MVKTAIDNNGNEVQVSDDTVVNTINGVFYLLTPEEQAAYDANMAEYELNKLDNLKAKKILQRQ